MNPRSRLLTVAAILAIGAIVAVVLTQKKTATSPVTAGTTPANANCIKAKPAIAKPSWFPADLPMPAGSNPIEIPAEASGYRRVVFDAKGSLRDFVVFALTNWKQQGWALGRGEAEPGEAEDNFVKSGRYGIFRVQSVMCDQSRSWVLVVLNDPAAKPKSTPSFQRFTSASPSPLQ